jgi:hypothetical protein
MTTIDKSHPYWHVRKIIEHEPIVQQITLSYYYYRPQSLVDERDVFSISRDAFLEPRKIEHLIEGCPSDHDLAIHSNVVCIDGNTRHIPMVDMSTGAKAHLKKLRFFLDRETYYGFAWFDSGRSFHGYGSRLISQSEWISYMGHLLLSNQKDLKPTVDPRWIGHRLIAGYSTLRWSKNTEHYVRLPRLLEDISHM